LDEAGAVVPSFESFSLTETGIEPAHQPKAEAFDFEWNSVAGDVSSGTLSFADLNEPEQPVAGDSVADPSALISADPFAAGIESVDENGGTAAEPSRDETKSASVDAMMRHERESVDFYITQGYYDIGFDTLELLERQFGTHPDIDARRKKLEAAMQSPQTPSIETGSEPAPGESVTEADATVAVVFGDIELTDSPVGSPADSSTVAPVVSKASPPASGSGIDSGLAAIFEEFRIEAEGETAPTNEDYETHYNMATAYKEMDLLDEAIREFQLAAGLTSAADSTPRYFQCCNLLGHCFVEKGMPQAAVLWFKKGLEVPGRDPEEFKALQYELGSAYEQMGDVTRAIAAFTEVYGVDVSYRDIGDRLSTLQRRAREE